MKIFIPVIFLTLFACDFHFGMADLKKGTCIQEVNSKYVSDGKNNGNTIYRVESKSSDEYSVATWHNHAWLFLSQKPRNYFIDGKIFKYGIVKCPDKIIEEEGMNAKIKNLNLWKK